MKTFYIEKSYIIASIIKTKKKYLDSSFVTYDELNYITMELQNKFNISKTNVIITEKINNYFYNLGEVISLKPNISIEGIEVSFYCPFTEVLSIVWDDGFICKQLIELRKYELEQLEKSKRKVTKSKSLKK